MSKPKSFTDLNSDVLLQVADFLAPPTWALGVHWLNGPQPLLSNADIRALRSTCRHVRGALPPPDLSPRIKNGFNVGAELRRWAQAPAGVLERAKRITLPPSDRRQEDLDLPAAQSRFDDFTTLLFRCPNLTTLDIAHSPFCVHDSYGLGMIRAFALTLPHDPILSISTLSVALKCRVCALGLTRVLASWCTLTSLRASVMSFDSNPLILSPLVYHLSALRTLHLKVPDDWQLTAILHHLMPCTGLRELHVAPYGASRKVAVVDNLGDVPPIVGSIYGMGNVTEVFLTALNAFDLEELDLCLSPAALDRSLADLEDGPVWREGATRAAERLVEACPTLGRGWWWIQVVDLDYGQLKGYKRWNWTVDDAIPSSRPSAAPFVSSKSSPSVTRTPIASKYAASAFTTPSSASSTRPLHATKVIPGTGTDRRRSVAFATQNQTKEFAKDSPIVPETAPPPSIRSYSPATSSPLPSSDRASSPSGPRRPILKASDPSSIRVARSVREGSWANREPARRLVVGNHPKGMARGGSLAQLCDTAEDGVAGKLPSEDDVPGSDDSVGGADAPGSEGSDEESEEIECMHPTSLVSVILEGAEDLLTLEEAYCTLTAKMREALYSIGPVTEDTQRYLDMVAEPISDEAPALVRAMTRDLSRLMGKVPQSEHSQSSTPFRGLQPETRPATARLPPSPSNTPSRRGYSEAEIRYRREASSVGAAALRFLAALFSSPRLFSAFSEADLIQLLEQVIMIPKTPVLPTPIPKRTYSLALSVMAHLRFPSRWVAQVQDKILDALDSAWNTLGNGGPPFAFKDSTMVKREAFHALSALLRYYPQIMVPGYQRYLATSLRAVSATDNEMRRLASGAVSAFVKARYQLLADAELAVRFECDDHAMLEWEDMRNLVRKSEQHTINFFKSMAKFSPKRFNDNRPDKGQQMRSEWSSLEAAFRSLIGKPEDVAWACSTWAAVATLLGSSYNSFPLVLHMDHIMDRSLQPSTNSVRPVLACTAWQHAIHAYLLAGSSCSISDGRMVHSFNPFTASSGQDVTARVNRIMFPFRMAVQEALNVDNFARALVEFPEFRNEKRWTWKRAERPRKAAYMVSAGSIAPAIVYAYTTLALDHEDLAAKEVSRLSGLPSSDGVAPDLTPEELRLPRLDRTFELILLPILKQSFPICGVDPLKNQAWSILEAVTAEPPTPTSRRSIDRLLSWRYFNGDVVHLEATDPTLVQELIRAFEGDRIKPSEIPAWGKLWVAKRLGKLLTLFVDAFDGIGGINNLSSVEWVCNADGIVLLPQTLSHVWTNLLRAMSITHVPEGASTPLFKIGLYAVTKTLLEIFDRDPVKYMPICLLNEEGHSTLSPSAIRLGVVMHLIRVAEEILGERALGTVQIESPTQPRTQEEDEAFGNPTVAGHVLKHILRSKHLTQTMDDKTRERFRELVTWLLRMGSTQNTRMLGHVANAMPWIFENHERLHFDVWRTLSLAWIGAVDLKPADTAAKTNYTGDLLVSLLSCPFRSESSDSVWYNTPADEDLAAWDSLLETTVLRFRAKRVGSNFGVLETLAAHLEDFAAVSGDDIETKRRLASPTMLHCLAVASSKVSLVPTEHYHASHFCINENYVPVDFLSFISSVLDASYPAAEPGAVARLVNTVSDVFRALPANAVPDVLEPLRTSLVMWMKDEEKAAGGDLVHELDGLYIAILSAITLAIESGSMPASSATMNNLIDIYAPRLSCARSAAVPTAFQDFWRRSFQPAGGLEYSDDVAGFLQDVLTAVPGLIIVEGLYSDESQSCASDRFPFAESVQPQIVEPAVAQDFEDIVPETQNSRGEYEEEADEAVDLSLDEAGSPRPTPANPSTDSHTDYDADVSQSQPQLKRKPEVLIDSSPSSTGSTDVFGPKKRAKTTKTSRRRTRSKAARSRASSPGVGSDTVIFGTDIEDEPTPTRQSRDANRPESIFGKFLRRVPSIGSFFAEHVPASYELEDTDVDEDEPGNSTYESINEEHVGNNTYNESASQEDIVDELRKEPVQPEVALSARAVTDEPAPARMDVESVEPPARKPAPAARVTRRSQSKQSAPSLEPTQVNSEPESQVESQSEPRRRSRRVANQSPSPEVRPTHSRKTQSVEPVIAEEPEPQLEVQPALPEPVARLRSAEPASQPAATQPEKGQSQRSTRSSARRKRESESMVEESVNRRPKRLRTTTSAPNPKTEAKDARSLRRERRQTVSRTTSAEPRLIEETPEVGEPEPQVGEPIEKEPAEEPAEGGHPVADVAAVGEPIEVDAPEEQLEPELEQEEQLEPELEQETQIEVDETPSDVGFSTVVEDLAGQLDLEEPADRSEAIPSAFQDAPSVLEDGASAFLDALDRSEAIPSAFQDAPTPPRPALARVPDPASANEDEEDEEEVERLTAQHRLLATLDAAVGDDTALVNLDLTGAHAVLVYARRLHDAAMATLAAFAREGEASRLRRTRTL
ncbi:hypothetical protein CspHIS471_0310490 [Cutaneotrichosporon sp. HIS471]|nr:hypothetical protein CspHIS471_0310490 [Cutaneotrichosporon sp. HIS471]